MIQTFDKDGRRILGSLGRLIHLMAHRAVLARESRLIALDRYRQTIVTRCQEHRPNCADAAPLIEPSPQESEELERIVKKSVNTRLATGYRCYVVYFVGALRCLVPGFWRTFREARNAHSSG